MFRHFRLFLLILDVFLRRRIFGKGRKGSTSFAERVARGPRLILTYDPLWFEHVRCHKELSVCPQTPRTKENCLWSTTNIFFIQPVMLCIEPWPCITNCLASCSFLCNMYRPWPGAASLMNAKSSVKIWSEFLSTAKYSDILAAYWCKVFPIRSA